MLKKLSDKNFINYQKYKGTSLTKKGQIIALEIIENIVFGKLFL